MGDQPFRLPTRGLIDRRRELSFRFDGVTYRGYAGDSLASALLANGVRLVGRSFKYHRPRGIFAAGAEEPNALVRLREGSRAEPNLRATQVELYEGLCAESQNRWPTLRFDIGSFLGRVGSRFMPAGFYYKTFMWPAGAWLFYERWIRRMAGLGRSSLDPDPDRYDKRFLHCDVLVAGGGPTGLAAALAAGRCGARVCLADENTRFGGCLLAERADVGEQLNRAWLGEALSVLEGMPNVRLLPRATVFGHYDHECFAISERLADHLPAPKDQQCRHRLWHVRAGKTVLATGATERPMVFADNDRPGVMLASAARTYVNRFGVAPGRRAVVFSNNHSALDTAFDLQSAGVDIAAYIDAREEGPTASARESLASAGTRIITRSAIIGTRGGPELTAVVVGRLSPDGEQIVGALESIDCDLLCVSGGWSPVIHLHSQHGGKLRWDEALAAFLPDEPSEGLLPAGGVRGTFDIADCMSEGDAAGREAAGEIPEPTGRAAPTVAALRPLWEIPARSRGKRFVDLQNDVTAADVALAEREGYRSVEHLKRYTTLGMGTDQGRTSNVIGLALIASRRGQPIAEVGTTTFRPPYTPVALGNLAGREAGGNFAPARRTPLHDWHTSVGAHMCTAGLWMRPYCYPRSGEAPPDAVYREAASVRAGVGIVDVSTLGKIDLQGRDIAEFLERIYINRWKNLRVGRCRYGIMLREDGMVFDDGTTTRVGETRFYMTTTTAHAAEVMSHLEYHAQVVWPDLAVYLTSVTDQWAAMAVAGPMSRSTLGAAVSDVNLANDSLPHLGTAVGRIAGAPVRLFRMTFSGELAYEVHTPAGFGALVWEAIMRAGEAFGIVPYGTESMSVLRIEKGHVVGGAEIDGRTTADDLGFRGMMRREGDFIGRRALERPAFSDPARPRLVGLQPVDQTREIRVGSQLVADVGRTLPVPMLGHVTSAAVSPELGCPIALAMLARSRATIGDRLFAVSPLHDRQVEVEVTSPVFVDPEGSRPRV